MEISKTYTFDAAHQLLNHYGKCARLHGHTYSVTVTVGGEPLRIPTHPEDGMLMDYSDLDGIVKPLIELVDHHFICVGNEPAYEALRVTTDDSCVLLMGITRTTAENLALWFLTLIAPKLEQRVGPGLTPLYPNVQWLSVSVSETHKTSATTGRRTIIHEGTA